MEDSFFCTVTKALRYLFQDTYSFVSGVALGYFGQLLPIKNIVHLLIIFFIADVFFGYWAAKKIRKEKFSVKIIWSNTIPRMLISIILITGAFMWDQVYEQEIIATYRVIGWFISGVLLYSIAENGYKITKWSMFPKIINLLGENIKSKTGIDINDKKETS